MDYSIWIDADGRRIPLEEMSDKYIKNCIKEIKRLYPSWEVALKQKEIDVPFTESWLVTHGEEYLGAFEQEKEIRRRIAHEEYPIVYLSRDCSTCDKKVLCEYKQDSLLDCENWEPSDLAIHSKLSSDVDFEICRRTHSVIVKEA